MSFKTLKQDTAFSLVYFFCPAFVVIIIIIVIINKLVSAPSVIPSSNSCLGKSRSGPSGGAAQPREEGSGDAEQQPR